MSDRPPSGVSLLTAGAAGMSLLVGCFALVFGWIRGERFTTASTNITVTRWMTRTVTDLGVLVGERDRQQETEQDLRTRLPTRISCNNSFRLRSNRHCSRSS